MIDYLDSNCNVSVTVAVTFLGAPAYCGGQLCRCHQGCDEPKNGARQNCGLLARSKRARASHSLISFQKGSAAVRASNSDFAARTRETIPVASRRN